MSRIDLQPQRLDISMVRGDSLRLIVTLTEQDSGAPLDLAGKEVFAAVRATDRVGSNPTPMQVMINGSEVELFMGPDDTRQLGARNHWDLSLVSELESRTVLSGNLSLSAEVSSG